MRNAFNNLPIATRGEMNVSDICTTHRYVKFKPSNDNELRALLCADSTLLLYPFPLDHDIAPGGTFYHDPSLPADVPTYQYASIGINQTIPTVCDYEILADLYIPNEPNEMTRGLSDDFTQALLRKAFEITDNEYIYDKYDNSDANQSSQTRSWACTGTIKVYDDMVGEFIPLPGARVRARQWFTSHYYYTDRNGHFDMGTMSGEANFAILWERYEKYDIRNGWVDQAMYNGPKKSYGWNLNINTGKSLRFATITRAAYRYYYGNIIGFLPMRVPASNNLKICYIDDSGTSDYWGNVSAGIVPDIRVYGKSSGSYRFTHEIFGTTIHEMAHANHCIRMTSIQFWQVEKLLYESWAEFVKLMLTRQEYSELELSEEELNALVNERMKTWPIINVLANIEYSPMFLDLYDDYNQRIELANEDYPNDNITGYSTTVLNQILLDSYGLTSLNENLKTVKPITVTDEMLDEFITFYHAVCPES